MCRAIQIFTLALFLPLSVLAIEKPDEMQKEVGISQNLGAEVNLELTFTDSNGVTKKLRDFLIESKPSILVPVYYDCPRLCGLVTNGVFNAARKMNFGMSKDYNLVFISIDPKEPYTLAAKRKLGLKKTLEEAQISPDNFHYLVGEKPQVSEVMSTLGFHYKEDGEDFAHSAAIMLVTPEGQISRYFTGIEFDPKDLRLSLVEASQGHLGSLVDQVLLYCFRFDPTKGKYTWAALNVMKAGGIITLLSLGSLLGVLWKRHR